MFGFPDEVQLTYEGLCADDRQLVDALSSCGADLDEARHVLHYIEVETEVTAMKVADLGAQWAASISPPTQDDETWFVVFEREDRVLSPTNILADRHLFETLASVFDGIYEGWEACV